MQFVMGIINFILHIDTHLADIISNYGVATYAFLFFIIFAETGLYLHHFYREIVYFLHQELLRHSGV
jgi:membrane-associated protein